MEELLLLSPQEFVDRLNSEIVEGIPRAQLIKTVLSQADYPKITEYLAKYQGHPQVGKYAQRLLSPEGKVWMCSVLDLIKNERLG